MHGHLTRELFRAIHQGWRNPGDLAAIAMAHLFELCPACRGEFEGWRRELEGEAPPAGAGDFDATLDRIRSSEAETDGDAVPKENRRQEARSRAQDLLALQPEDRAEWIRSETATRSGLLLAEALIEECRGRTPGHPHQGYTLANLARLALQHAPASVEATQLYVRALAYLANAVRVIGDFPRAEQILGDARYLLRGHGVGHRLVRAELDRLEGTLLNSQFRPRAAISLLLRAQIVYRMEGRQSEAAATLLLLARSHRYLDELTRSSQVLREAERILSNHPSNRLLMILGERRAEQSLSSGYPDDAMAQLEEVEERRSSLGDPLVRLRGKWLRGRIHRAVGDLEMAEEKFRGAMTGFSAHRMLDDVARIQLELARLYIEQGRLGEARTLTDEAEPVFVDNHLPVKVAESRRLRALAACRST